MFLFDFITFIQTIVFSGNKIYEGIWSGLGENVTVFQTYRQEAVLVMTTRLPIGLVLSHVMVDNCMWPSVSLGPYSVVSGFPAKCLDIPSGVTGSDITPPSHDFPP